MVHCSPKEKKHVYRAAALEHVVQAQPTLGHEPTTFCWGKNEETQSPVQPTLGRPSAAISALAQPEPVQGTEAPTLGREPVGISSGVQDN